MKCTNCGCKKLMRIESPFEYYGEQHISIYSCFDCGHLEFFSTTAVEKYNELLLKKSNILTELKNLETTQDNLTKISMIYELANRLKKGDCTDSQKAQMQDKLKDLENQVGQSLTELTNFPMSLDDLIQQIHSQDTTIEHQMHALKNELYSIEQAIEKVEILNG